MSKSRLGIICVSALGLAAVLPVVAFAAHGKAGLWEVTSTVNMPNMPQMSQAQMAQMQAMGMHMPMGHTFTVRHCVTADEVAQDKPPPMRSKECTMTNVRIEGHTFSGDTVCTGEFQGQGHFSVTYDGNEHYTGTSTTTGTAEGHPVNSSTSFEGKWISADCGSVK